MKQALMNIFNADGHLDKKSVDSLISAIATQSLQGFDYLKFRQSLNAMMNLGQDRVMALKSSFATAQTMGITKQKLMQTAEHYVAVLSREKVQFDNALKKQLHQKVDSKLNETEFFKEKIQEYRTKISELEAEIKTMEKKIASVDKEVAQSKDKILDTQEKFEHTFDAFVATIKEDIGLMENYL